MGSIVSMKTPMTTTAMMMGVIQPFFGGSPTSTTPIIINVVVVPTSLVSLHFIETDLTNLLDSDPPPALLIFAILHAGPHADVSLIRQQDIGVLWIRRVFG